MRRLRPEVASHALPLKNILFAAVDWIWRLSIYPWESRERNRRGLRIFVKSPAAVETGFMGRCDQR